MKTVVFDDAGRAWDIGSQALRTMLHCPYPDFELVAYLVNNVGFVAVTTIRQGSARFRFRPKVVSQVSLAAALFALVEQRPDRIIISYPGNDELFVSLKRALARIEELLSTDQSSRPPAFINVERAVQSLIGANNTLSSLLLHWINDRHDPLTGAELLRDCLHGRYMVVEAADNQLTIGDVGSGFLSYDRDWREKARGLPVDSQPDYAYGLWTAKLFRSVLERGQPRLDEIDAVIQRPCRGDSVRVRYRCLLLPYASGPTGLPFVLSASIVDDDIDLRADSCRLQNSSSDILDNMRVKTGIVD